MCACEDTVQMLRRDKVDNTDRQTDNRRAGLAGRADWIGPSDATLLTLEKHGKRCTHAVLVLVPSLKRQPPSHGLWLWATATCYSVHPLLPKYVHTLIVLFAPASDVPFALH